MMRWGMRFMIRRDRRAEHATRHAVKPRSGEGRICVRRICFGWSLDLRQAIYQFIITRNRAHAKLQNKPPSHPYSFTNTPKLPQQLTMPNPLRPRIYPRSARSRSPNPSSSTSLGPILLFAASGISCCISNPALSATCPISRSTSSCGVPIAVAELVAFS